MIANLQPYLEYKESGLPSVGRMPAHWAQRRMKFLFRERVQKGFPNEPLLAATQTKGVVRKADYGERTVTVTKDFHLLKLVETGDFVISLRSFEGGIEVAHCRGIISPAYTVLTPRPEARGSYFTRFFKSPDFIRSLTLFVTGIREGQNIDYERMSRAYMPLPPADEQDLMGRFLDYANGRLERAIRAKRKVIALLHEQKQAIIHRAVTRGLDPTVPLKPSGIPWLGDIPKHWELTPLGAITNYISYGFTNPMPATDQGPYMLTAADIAKGKIQYATARHTSDYAFQYLLTDKSRPRAGDLLITKDGTLGRVAIADGEPVCINQSVALLRLTPGGVSRDFIADALQAEGYQQMMIFNAGGTTIKHIYITRLVKMKMALPPLHEQQAIVADIQRTKLAFGNATGRIEREIELLREYRTRLVADVVTGKLDVRPAARQLPAESVAPEPTPDPEELPEPEPEETE